MLVLANHIAYCDVAGNLVLLDIRRDRYVLLPTRLASALGQINAGLEGDGPDDEAIRQLAALGYCTPGQTAGSPRSAVQVPAADSQALVHAGGRQSFGKLFEAFGMLCLTRIAVAIVPFRWLATALSACDRVGHGKSNGQVPSELIRAFIHARRFFDSRGRCLPESVALCLLLRLHGYSASVVFGVKLDPFEAHCWVQNRNLILADAIERVLPFTPILKL